jgi:hypothetical protein
LHGAFDRDTRYEGIPPEMWFLLLREVSDGVYERIGAGVCSAGYSEPYDTWPEVKAWDGRGLRFECPLFEDSEVRSIQLI